MAETTDATENAPAVTGPILINDAELVRAVQEFVRPAAGLWTKADTAATQIGKVDGARALLPKLMAMMHDPNVGPHAVIADGRNNITVEHALATLIIGRVVRTFINEGNTEFAAIFGTKKPGDYLYAIAGEGLNPW